MKPAAQAKVAAVRASLRQVAAALRPAFPAWIDAESGLAFSAAVALPRVRDCLVLRLVEGRKPHPRRPSSDGPGAR